MFLHPLGIDRIKEIIKSDNPNANGIKIVNFDGDNFIIDGHHRYFIWFLNKFAERGEKQRAFIELVKELFKEAPIRDDELIDFFNQLNRELDENYPEIFYGEFFDFMLEKPLPEEVEIIKIETQGGIFLPKIIAPLFRRAIEWLPYEAKRIDRNVIFLNGFPFVGDIKEFKKENKDLLIEIKRIIDAKTIEGKINAVHKIDETVLNNILDALSKSNRVIICECVGINYTTPSSGYILEKLGENEVLFSEYIAVTDGECEIDKQYLLDEEEVKKFLLGKSFEFVVIEDKSKEIDCNLIKREE